MKTMSSQPHGRDMFVLLTQRRKGLLTAVMISLAAHLNVAESKYLSLNFENHNSSILNGHGKLFTLQEEEII